MLIALPDLGARDLWYDESFSVTSTNQLATSLRQRSGSMGLYYLLLSPWTQVSLDPFWLRIPSALFAAGAAGLTCRFALRFFGRPVAIWTTLIMVPSFGVIRYAQEVRSYSLVMLLAVVSWSLFFRQSERTSTKLWVLWGVCSAALVYSHPLAGLVPASQFVALRAAPPALASMTRRSIPGWVTFVACLSPMLATIGARTGAAPSWVPPLSWRTVGDAVSIIAGFPGAAQFAILVALVAATASALVSDSTRHPVESWRRRSLALWLWVPPVVLVLISVAEPVFVPRYVIAIVPAAALLLALAVVRLPQPASTIVGVALVVAMLPGLVQLHRTAGHQWSDAVASISESMDAGSVHGLIFNYDEVRQPFEINGQGSRVLDESVPVRPGEPWGSLLRYHDQVGDDQIIEAAAQLDVLWEVTQLFVGDPRPEGERYEWLGFCHTSTEDFRPGIQVSRFDRC